MTAKNSLLADDETQDESSQLTDAELSDSTEDGDDEGIDVKEVVVVEPVDELKTVLAAELSTDTTQYYLNQIGTRPLLTAPE